MTKNLVIVESPAKAKTIEKFLGKDYKVVSSFGHIRDLPKKGMSIDIENDFEPTYEISDDKKKVVSDLKKRAKEATTVWLASDEDREGEAIAWHLAQALSLTDAKSKRIVFHEITEPAIKRAIENPRKVDKKLVDAQQARRVLDRLVGYELSPVLWKKVRPGLSAGRVQSVAVRIIVEREAEIKEHKYESTYKVLVSFKLSDGTILESEYPKKLDGLADARKFLETLKAADFTVLSVEQKPGKKRPSAPFTTSTLQQEASQKLGYPVRMTMSLAQRLYESGYITYMRTDSFNMSSLAISAAEKQIVAKYGKEYSDPHNYVTKNASAQEAHEAIRPTDFTKPERGKDERQKKLYKLIYNRALASQMTPAEVEKTEVDIKISNHRDVLKAKGEIVIFDGFLKAYAGKDTSKKLPKLEVDQKLELDEAHANQTFTKPPARYTEASLVKKLEEMGIGRPSTYAPTISTIQDRGYVEKLDLEPQQREITNLTLKSSKITETKEQENFAGDRNKLMPTDMAKVVNDFLTKYFKAIVDYDFTSDVEAEFDLIADGKEKWNRMISDFYKDFHKTVKSAENVSKQEVSQARKLGKDPKSGKPVIARYGRYGPMLQIGEAEDDEKPRFAPLPEGKTLEDVKLEEALRMFRLPRTVGKTADGEEILANIGRFGPYVKVGDLFVSIKDESPFTIKEDKARIMIKAKKKAEAEKYIQRWEDEKIDIINGRYGPYITDGTKNAKIPKESDPKKITLKEAQKLLKDAPAKRFRGRKKAASK